MKRFQHITAPLILFLLVGFVFPVKAGSTDSLLQKKAYVHLGFEAEWNKVLRNHQIFQSGNGYGGCATLTFSTNSIFSVGIGAGFNGYYIAQEVGRHIHYIRYHLFMTQEFFTFQILPYKKNWTPFLNFKIGMTQFIGPDEFRELASENRYAPIKLLMSITIGAAHRFHHGDILYFGVSFDSISRNYALTTKVGYRFQLNHRKELI